MPVDMPLALQLPSARGIEDTGGSKKPSPGEDRPQSLCQYSGGTSMP